MTRTRSGWLVALIFTATLIGGTTAYAADDAAAASQRQGMQRRLQERLGLTDDQTKAVHEIYARQAEASKQLWQTLRQAQGELRQLALTGGDEGAIKAKIAEIERLLGQSLEMRTKTLREIAPVLTPEQREKFAKMGDEGSRRMRRHREQGS